MRSITSSSWTAGAYSQADVMANLKRVANLHKGPGVERASRLPRPSDAGFFEGLAPTPLYRAAQKRPGGVVARQVIPQPLATCTRRRVQEPSG
jgi:hypothetical protein